MVGPTGVTVTVLCTLVSLSEAVMLAAQALAGFAGAGLRPTLVLLIANHYHGRQQSEAVVEDHPATRRAIVPGAAKGAMDEQQRRSARGLASGDNLQRMILAEMLQRAFAGDRFNPAHAGRHAAFFQDLDQANLAGSAGVTVLLVQKISACMSVYSLSTWSAAVGFSSR